VITVRSRMPGTAAAPGPRAPATAGTDPVTAIVTRSAGAQASWPISAGAPPPGLTSNSSTSEVSGTPATAGTYSFTARVTDSTGTLLDMPQTITIVNPLRHAQRPVVTELHERRTRMKLKFRPGRVIAGAALAALLPLLLTPAAQAQAAPWTVVPSADASTGNNILDAVTSVAANDVWAVGSGATSTGLPQALIEHWDGTAWSLVSSPTELDSTLSGVTAASASDVWAVGSFLNSDSVEQALFEHWNGHKWSPIKSPATGPGTEMFAVAAVSSKDIWAVGQFLSASSTAQALIEHSDGHKWAVVPSPAASTENYRLVAVTAVSADDVWAVGTAQDTSGDFQTLTEHWDGTAWSIIPSPNGTGFESELNSAAAVSSTDVWAVGDSGSGTLAEQWNGSSWTVVPSPSPGPLSNSLNGLAVVSAADIWAAGESVNDSGIPSTLIEQWDGTSWTTVTSPSPGSAADLSGASADPVSGQAWAVGNFRAASGAQQTLTEFNP
jgi:Putative Ig domain